ncbi:MAG TPA: iron-sulfur cluster assembly protein [Edaphobacter sp.]|jgi:metal-sulfur cluster biosynthetic enzyme|nr:iron-sulfur cluster assembly protein [Edaphobacter sp.]
MLTEADILLALRDCYDPTLPCNIVDLGLIHSIEVTADHEAPGADISGVPQKHRIKIEITPPQTDEVALAQLRAQIINRLAGLETVSHTEVAALDHPKWSPLQITLTGRRTLGLDGNPNLVQIR